MEKKQKEDKTLFMSIKKKGEILQRDMQFLKCWVSNNSGTKAHVGSQEFCVRGTEIKF